MGLGPQGEYYRIKLFIFLFLFCVLGWNFANEAFSEENNLALVTRAAASSVWQLISKLQGERGTQTFNLECHLSHYFILSPSQALMRIPPRSVRTCHQPHRKKERRREKTGSLRSRRCWCSISKIQRPLPCKWREPFLSSTPCCTGNPHQVCVRVWDKL